MVLLYLGTLLLLLLIVAIWIYYDVFVKAFKKDAIEKKEATCQRLLEQHAELHRIEPINWFYKVWMYIEHANIVDALEIKYMYIAHDTPMRWKN